MKRRGFVALVPVAAAAPFAALAQSASKTPTIGFISPNTGQVYQTYYAAFAKRFGELGWSGTRIDYREASGSLDKVTVIASEFANLKVDAIVTVGDAQVLAAKKAAGAIPIVFGAAGDPVGNGLVASLAHPGGNATGLSVSLTETAGKREELLHELVPTMRVMAILGNFSNPQVGPEREAARTAARNDKIETIEVDLRKIEDLAADIAALKGRAQALYVCTDSLTNSYPDLINALALSSRLPVMYAIRGLAATGGMISYGPDIADMFRRAAEMVDKILRGTRPADIPVEQPTKFTLLVNLRTAKALDLTIPPSVLARADEVIE